MENMKDKVVAGLKDFIAQSHNDNRAAAARALGVKHMTLINWIEGNRTPNLEALQPVFDTLGWQIVFPGQSATNYAKLLYLKDIDAYLHQQDMEKGESVPVDLLEYVRTKGNKPELLFSFDLLESIGVDAKNALIFSPDTDVMHPVISRGDHVLVDKTRTKVTDGKIYLIHAGAYFLLRRVSRELNGDLILHAETSVPNMTITPELRPRINILGEVVWVGKAL